MSKDNKEKRRIVSNTIRAKPKEKVSYKEILREVEARTGFRYSDIRTVYLCIIDVIKERILEKKVVRIPNLGMIFPSIKRSRPGRNMQTGESLVIPSRWQLKFQPGPGISEELLDLEVTEDEEVEMFSFLNKEE